MALSLRLSGDAISTVGPARYLVWRSDFRFGAALVGGLVFFGALQSRESLPWNIEGPTAAHQARLHQLFADLSVVCGRD